MSATNREEHDVERATDVKTDGENMRSAALERAVEASSAPHFPQLEPEAVRDIRREKEAIAGRDSS
jgi:hypothetical protein